MKRVAPILWTRLACCVTGLVVVAGIAVHGLLRYDKTTSVEHRIGIVRDVHPVAGGDASDRLVITDLGDYSRAIRLSDWMIRAEAGETVCVQKRRLLVRTWSRHRITFPAMCKGVERPSVTGLHAPPGA